jgi:hypothetical protein
MMFSNGLSILTYKAIAQTHHRMPCSSKTFLTAVGRKLIRDSDNVFNGLSVYIVGEMLLGAFRELGNKCLNDLIRTLIYLLPTTKIC